MDTTHAHAVDIQKHIRVYLTVFAALAVLTVVTVGVAYLELPMSAALPLALVIATVKGLLVAGYFMHLVSEQKVVYALVGLSVVLLLIMFALFISVYLDQDGGALLVP